MTLKELPDGVCLELVAESDKQALNERKVFLILETNLSKQAQGRERFKYLSLTKPVLIDKRLLIHSESHISRLVVNQFSVRRALKCKRRERKL